MYARNCFVLWNKDYYVLWWSQPTSLSCGVKWKKALIDINDACVLKGALSIAIKATETCAGMVCDPSGWIDAELGTCKRWETVKQNQSFGLNMKEAL